MLKSLDAPLARQRKRLRISTDIPLSVRCSSNFSSSLSSPSSCHLTFGTTPNVGIAHSFFHVLCMYDFESSDPTHLPFRKNEVLTIIKQELSGWSAAMRPHEDRIGWIPSSFVLPLDVSKIAEHPDETWSYGSLNDPPISAIHDSWVPVSEDCAAVSFRLVTPTDLILYKGSFEERSQNQNYEPFLSLPDDGGSSDTTDVYVPPTLAGPPLYSRHPLNPRVPEPGAPQLIRPASPPLRDAVLYHHVRPRRMWDESFLCLSTPISSDETIPELTSDVDSEDSPVDPQPIVTCSDGTDDHSQFLGLSTDFLGPDRAIPDKLLDLELCGPDHLAEQLCVLMHKLYANIRQNECLDWMAGRRSTDVSGLQYFFDMHNYITCYVQKSILLFNDITRQVETLDKWIRVAERCNAARNFDSLCAIILALSGSSSSLGSAWARCTQKQTFAMLRDIVGVANKFYCLVNIMDAANGPSVPFVRRYLDHIRELHMRGPKLPPQPGYTADAEPRVLRKLQLAAVSALLRHQNSQYDFKSREAGTQMNFKPFG